MSRIETVTDAKDLRKEHLRKKQWGFRTEEDRSIVEKTLQQNRIQPCGKKSEAKSKNGAVIGTSEWPREEGRPGSPFWHTEKIENPSCLLSERGGKKANPDRTNNKGRNREQHTISALRKKINPPLQGEIPKKRQPNHVTALYASRKKATKTREEKEKRAGDGVMGPSLLSKPLPNPTGSRVLMHFDPRKK